MALAATRQQQAAPLLALLLEAGADPTLPSPATGAAAQPSLLPLPEAAAAGCMDAVAHLLRWAAERGGSLLQLGWPAATAAAARRSLRSDSCHEAHCLQQDARERQQQLQTAAEVAAAVAPESCRTIVAALLEAHAQQQTTLGAAVLVSGLLLVGLLALAILAAQGCLPACTGTLECARSAGSPPVSSWAPHPGRLPLFAPPRVLSALPAGPGCRL